LTASGLTAGGQKQIMAGAKAPAVFIGPDAKGFTFVLVVF